MPLTDEEIIAATGKYGAAKEMVCNVGRLVIAAYKVKLRDRLHRPVYVRVRHGNGRAFEAAAKLYDERYNFGDLHEETYATDCANDIREMAKEMKC